MKLRLICVGKVKNPSLRALSEDYSSRIRRFASFEVLEVRDGKAPEGAARLREEAESIRRALGRQGGGKFTHAVLWDERGEAPTTRKFSGFLENALIGRPCVDFVIGSSHGVDAPLKEEIPRHFQLSAMTLTHEWARALALEQIYRAFCVLRGLPYHH
jgi:23S rRNA (pseudouridine1915-N3)-methyltransferase